MDLSLLCLNINGGLSKLENKTVIEFLNQFDIVTLIELKSAYTFSVPGFATIRSKLVEGEEMRGGVAVLVKFALWQQVIAVTQLKDQIWFQLCSLPEYCFGACYIAPLDSPYFSQSSFAQIQENVINKHAVVLGDFNARIPNLEVLSNPMHGISYAQNVDQGRNNHGKELVSLCKDNNLYTVNHISFQGVTHEGDLTFHQKQQGVSQIDWAIVSEKCLPFINEFHIYKKTPLKTNHSALHLSLHLHANSTSSILERAKSLGSYDLFMKTQERSYKVQSLQKNEFQNNLCDVQDIWPNVTNGQTTCDLVTDALLAACDKSYMARYTDNANEDQTQVLDATQRWNRLTERGSAKEIWNAIAWNGTFTNPPDQQTHPTDEDFKTYFEGLLNQDEVQQTYIPEVNTHVPILDDDITPTEVETQLKRLKSSKAAGVDGLPPGVLKWLPDDWILLLTYLCNAVFNGTYPEAWSEAKLFAIYKKGERLDPANYRGISILPALSKVYDGILNERFYR